MEEQLHAENDVVRGDANQIHQVFVNLIMNSIAAMKENGGILTIETKPLEWLTKEEESQIMQEPGPYISIAIKDTGCGIARSELPKIFDPFYTKSTDGTGMGLPVAHGIVSEHKGIIQVESQAGKGSEFIVVLPVIHRESSV